MNAGLTEPGAAQDAERADLHTLAPGQRLALLRSLKGSGKTVSLRTTGLSMRPLISEDSVAEITFMSVDGVRTGDVVLFHARDAVVLHRVVRLRRENNAVSLVEKGDHQPFSSTITGEQVLGVMTALQTGGRHLCRASAGWRVQAALFVILGRIEMFLYRVKTRRCGRGSTRTGRFFNRMLNGLRRGVLSMTPGDGRKGGGGT